MDTSLDDISGWDNGKAATLQHLQEQGYVLPKQLDELAIVQQLYNQDWRMAPRQ